MKARDFTLMTPQELATYDIPEEILRWVASETLRAAAFTLSMRFGYSQNQQVQLLEQWSEEMLGE